VLEAVPNVSEGRRPDVVSAIADAFSVGVELLDVHSDADHHRSVFTLVGEEAALIDALLAGITASVERIDLTEHVGVHPRVGAADVVPLVPLVPEDMPRAISAARELAARIGSELGLPVFLYGEAGGGRRPAFFRRGGLEGLRARVEEGGLVEDEGPHEIDQRVAWKRGPCRWVSWKTPNRGWFQCDLPEGHPGPHAYWRARPDLSNYSGAPTHQIETIPERGGVCTCVEGSDEWGKHRDPNCPVHGATDPRDCQPISDRLPVEVRFRA